MTMTLSPRPENNLGQILLIVGIFAIVVFVLVVLAVFTRYFRLWIQSVTTGAGIGIFDLLGMTFRKVDPRVIVRSKIMAVQAGLGRGDGHHVSKALEAHYLAGGNVPLVIRAIIAANKAKIVDLDFKQATAIDLAGRNVLEAVQTSVYPKVIDCPARGSARDSLDGDRPERHPAEGPGPGDGAGEPAAVDRRGHGGDDHRPGGRGHRQRDRLGGHATARCWRIPTRSPRRCSPGGSIRRRPSRSSRSTSPTSTSATTSAPGCRPTRPRPTLRVARANAEGRRAMAVAEEQEMIAQIEENRAKVVEAEAEVPKAIAAGVPRGKPGHHGLLQAAQRAGRHRDAHGDRAARHEDGRRIRRMSPETSFWPASKT